MKMVKNIKIAEGLNDEMRIMKLEIKRVLLLFDKTRKKELGEWGLGRGWNKKCEEKARTE